MEPGLTWLPARADWSALLAQAAERAPGEAFELFQQLANSRMDFVRAARLDRAVQRYLAIHGRPADLPTLRLALLSSSNISALIAPTRIGALRRGLLLEIYEGPYGTYRQEIADPHSALHRFQPEALCLSLDAQHIAGTEAPDAEATLADLRALWAQARTSLGCVVLQQTVLPWLPTLAGNNEERLPHAPAAVVERLNHGLREHAAADGVLLLSVDRWAAEDGIRHWFDPALWYTAKQEIHPRASDVFGDQLGRLLAALRGRSGKCLVLDLDNTLWGGVIGDDSVEGIVLGQGTAAGEAHVALQEYARRLSHRGILLAVCSKNDESNAFAAFDRHPEMVLKRRDIACFVANWRDKASNLREIATRLNIGLDSLVFVDDNPAERALIRRELPMVAVPEMPDEIADYVPTLAAAGYFEAVDITAEDRERATQYRANAEREGLRLATTDMDSFLRALDMRLTWAPFNHAGLKRIVQLINKTNQFNLTTRRYTEAEVLSLMGDPDVVTLQLRLTDTYGDNGMIGVTVGHRTPENALRIDVWLMSCRVLGRQVEEATLNLLAQQAQRLGCKALLGEFRATAKNGMVAEHYARLGFSPAGSDPATGGTLWSLDLAGFTPRTTHLAVQTQTETLATA